MPRVLAVGGSAVLLALASTRGVRAVAADPVAAVVPLSETDRREVEIDFYSERASRDPISAADRSRLAGLYLDRARETGSFSDLKNAEAKARESLALREAHNAGTQALLAAALMGQHRFAEALAAARRADALEPGLPAHQSMIGEIALELGQYDRARLIFDSLRHARLSDGAELRMARWYEISGRPDVARSRLRRVLVEWERLPDASPSNVAWLRLRLAELAMKEARFDEADSNLTAGLRRAPNDHRLLAAAARLAARRGGWDYAIALGERAIAIALDPATLGILSDAYAAKGEPARAAQFATVMRTVAFSDTTSFPHRAWSLWMLDHDRDVATVLRLARAELATRKDVYAYDLYAWALYKSGRRAEARTAMQQALGMGTRDVQLQHHADAILR